MNHGRTILVLALLGFAACSQKPATITKSSKGSLGTFKASNGQTVLDLNGLPQVMASKQYLTLGTDTVELTKVCRHGDEKIMVKVVAPAVVTKGYFEIKAAQQKTEKLGRLDCTAKLDAGVTTFEIKDEGLTLTNTKGSSFFGYRVGQSPAEQKRREKVGAGSPDYVAVPATLM